MSPQDFLVDSLNRSPSSLVVSGERTLNAEFGTNVRAREVLTAVGDEANGRSPTSNEPSRA